MGWWGVTLASLLISGATATRGGESVATTTLVAPSATRVVDVSPLPVDVDDPRVSAGRFAAAVLNRLKPIEARFREDRRLRHAGAVVGVGALALGALRRDQPLRLVGMGALRVGLDSQLCTIERTTGFSVSPRLESGGFSIFVTRKFQ